MRSFVGYGRLKVAGGTITRVAWSRFLWSDEVIEHLDEHGVTPEEFEEIVKFPEARGQSPRTRRPCCWGHAHDGRFLICVYEVIDDTTILPVTAYEVPMSGEERR